MHCVQTENKDGGGENDSRLTCELKNKGEAVGAVEKVLLPLHVTLSAHLTGNRVASEDSERDNVQLHRDYHGVWPRASA